MDDFQVLFSCDFVNPLRTKATFCDVLMNDIILAYTVTRAHNEEEHVTSGARVPAEL